MELVRRSDVWNGTGCTGDRSNSEGVGCAAGVRFDIVLGRVLVDGAWDLVDIKQFASFWISFANNLDSESFHHCDGHVDVWLRDDLSASELQYDGL